jgi:hypothetical protein
VDRRLALTAASAVLAVLTAACGGSSAATPSASSPTIAASTAPSASPAPTEAAVATTSVTVPNQDTNLEALLPSTFAGTKLQKISMKGSQYLGANSELGKVVTELGLTTADVSVAIATSPGSANSPTFVAVRFAGADSGKLLQVFQAATVASGDVVTPANVAGKDVLKTTDKAGATTYFYVHNDVVLGVTAKDEATAAAGLALLP